MPDFRLSRLALADLQSITEYTARTWGQEQAERYIQDFRQFLHLLAANPDLGRACDDIRKGYRRMEQGRHVVFYKFQNRAGDIDVVRILHQRMLPGKHFIEE